MTPDEILNIIIVEALDIQQDIKKYDASLKNIIITNSKAQCCYDNIRCLRLTASTELNIIIKLLVKITGESEKNIIENIIK
jgi:hypothetical protein